jgi:hypothetical protein
MQSVPGTRRGLRQMLRYGTIRCLKAIFEKHAVHLNEVQKFISRDSAGN